jgi:lysophospholipase L1-like esterase
MRSFGLLLLFAPILVGAQIQRDRFALQDGDTVVFFGDSNTEWGTYPKLIETYTVLRYPERRIRFINAGADGDMASKAYFRLDSDVFKAGATVVVLLFGVNDIGWGHFDAESRTAFLDYMTKIVDACRARHVRVYVLSYPLTGAPIGRHATDPYFRFVSSLTASDTSRLQRLGDEVMTVARTHGAEAIDVQRGMREMVRTLPPNTRLHSDDGVHLNDLGNHLLGLAILKGLGAPAIVSSVDIDAKQLGAKANGAIVTGLKRTGGTIQFNRLDRGLPLTFSDAADTTRMLATAAFTSVNGFFLTFRNLSPTARYDLRVDNFRITPPCGITGARLNEVNLAAFSSSYYRPRGPWAQQAISVGRLAGAKADIVATLTYQRRNDPRATRQSASQKNLLAAIDRATEAEYAIARPRVNRYTLEPHPADSAGRCSGPQ